MLEHPETKQTVVQRKWFIGGQQEKLENVLATIGKFFQFVRTMVLIYTNNLESFSLILLCMSEFSEFIWQ